MPTKVKTKIAKLISDYQLWIASIEEYLEDHNINKRNISQRLSILKKQLAQIFYLQSLLDVYQKINYIDNRLQSIQTELILIPAYSQ